VADYDDYTMTSRKQGEGPEMTLDASRDAMGPSVIQRNQCIFRNTETPVSDASSFRDNIHGCRAD